MKAILVYQAGGPEELRLTDVPSPEPRPGEVRVQLHSIGVNYADVMCRKAIHRSMRPPPIVVGCEAAGVIDACGPGVTQRRVGERVGVYSPFGGAYAESLVVPERYALPLPSSMRFDEGAAFTHVYLTAYEALHGVVPLARNATVLVTAAAGGLGGALLQLTAAAGARVIACVGSRAKHDLLIERGVATVINYGKAEWEREVLEATGGGGVDLAIETVGGRIFQAAQRLLAPLGRIVIAGMASGEDGGPNIPVLLERSATCSTLNLSVVFAHRPERIQESWPRLCALYTAGLLTPRIGSRFPLEAAADAHRLLESRGSVDKILLAPIATRSS